MIWKDFRRDDIQIWEQRWRKSSPTEINETQCDYFRTKRIASKMNNLFKYQRWKISQHFPLDFCTMCTGVIHLTKSLNLNAEYLLGITKFSDKSKKGILYTSTVLLMMKSEARTELHQKSMCSPGIWRLQRHHLIDLSDLAEDMRLGQLFLQCRSDPQAKQVPLLNWVLGRKTAYRKGLSKGLESVVAPRRELVTREKEASLDL